jgi:hypothetical protein
MKLILAQADAAALPLADNSVDFVLGSPPYLDARTYGIGAQRHCQEWIDWMLRVTAEAVRVCRGMVVWVVAGTTRKWRYQPGPEGLLYEWWKRGGHARRPVYWRRVGIPGSGGKDWFRSDVEYCLAFAKVAGQLSWSDNTAMGHPPRWAPGGEMSHRLADGQRVNQWGRFSPRFKGVGSRRRNGQRQTSGRTSDRLLVNKAVTRRRPDSERDDGVYVPPVLANPGNLIQTKTGGGAMGSKLAHENEAPYPEALAEWWIRSMCPPGGIVLDPFCGSGTTAAVALWLLRRAITFDLRASQVELARRRINETVGLFTW